MGWTQQSIHDVKMAADLERVIGRDTKLTREGPDLVGCCCLPGHKDDTPSLHVAVEKGLWRCHGCNRGGSSVDWVKLMRGCGFRDAMLILSEMTAVPLLEETKGIAKRQLVATYNYTNTDGALLYAIERWEPGKNGRSKDILQRQGDGSYGKSAVQVLYRLPEVIAAVAARQPVFVVEGEKAADALAALGVCATTHAGGASAGSTWARDGFTDALKDADVVLLPDNDDPGRKLMTRVAAALGRVARSVTTITLPVRGEGDDIVEWLAEGGDLQAFKLLVESSLEQVQTEDREWKTLLRWGQRDLKGSPGNAELIINNDPELNRLFAYDDFASRVVLLRQPPWAEVASAYPRPLVDHDVVRLAVWMERNHNIDFGVPTLGATISSCANRASFNPLTDWLNSLKWDGTPRLSKWLHTYAGAADTIYTHAVGRAWAISTVARALRPGCQVDTTIVLEGTQGRGKSSLLRAFVGSEWFLDHLPDFSSKDAAILVAKAWVHELSELATLNKSEVEKIKQFLTQRADVYRAPYAANTIDVPRKCVFAATTNRSDYLRDTTGNRRFWPVKTGDIDVPGVARDRSQLWAEAVAAFRAGESWHITNAEVLGLAQEEQALRVEQDIWLANVAKFVETQPRVTTAEVLHHLGMDIAKRTPRDGERVCGILRGLGWTEERVRTGGSRIRVWLAPPEKPTLPGGPEGGPEVDQRPSVHSSSRGEAVSDGGPKGPKENAKTLMEHTGPMLQAPLSLPDHVAPVLLSNPLVHSGPLVQGLSEAVKSGPKDGPEENAFGPSVESVDIEDWEVGEF